MQLANVFIFTIGDARLSEVDVNRASRDFGFNYRFNANRNADDAQALFGKLVEKNPHAPVAMYKATRYSKPQPAVVQEITS